MLITVIVPIKDFGNYSAYLILLNETSDSFMVLLTYTLQITDELVMCTLGLLYFVDVQS